jgi:hypothetical protein
MTSPSNSAVQNLLPVQAYFDVNNNFVTFIGQGLPFTASISPDQSGLHITSSTINSTTIGATTPSSGAFTSFSTVTGTITTVASGPNDIVNKQYVDFFASGLSWKPPAITATSGNITLSGLQTINGVTVAAGDTVLVKDQTNSAENGIYIASATAWTYSKGGDIWSEYVGAIIFIASGSLSGTAWYCTAQPGGTLGVTAMVWANFSVASSYTAGTGLSLIGTQFSITNTGVTAASYGSATTSAVIAVNAQGQITSASSSTITPAVGSITGLGTGIATFLATPTSANLAAAVTDETGSGSLVFATSPTLVTPALGTPASGVMTNVTGLPLTTGVTGTLAIGNGGTGQTTASAAFNALSPITSVGDLIIGNGTNSATRLAIGTNGQVLTSNGTTASWATQAANVSSFSGGTTGLTPNTPTTGAVTLAGTLVAANGGTGQSSYTVGDILYASTTTALSKLADVATGNALISGGVGAAPSWGKIDLTTTVSGILPSANGGTGNGFFAVSGPTTSLKTFTFPDASATVLTTNALVTVAQGGTGVGTLTGIAYGNGTSAFTAASAAQVVAVIGSTAVTNATNATNIGITDDTSTNATMYPTWVTTTTGNLPAKTSSTKFSFNPSTGTLSATVFSGALANALTAGTGLTATATYNGSAAITFNATGSTINSQTTGYTLVAGDAGKTISITTGGVTVPNAVLSAGNIVTIYNNSGSSQTITQGASLTLQWAGQSSSTTGNRTLGLYGIATIIFISSSVAVISGAGLT